MQCSAEARPAGVGPAENVLAVSGVLPARYRHQRTERDDGESKTAIASGSPEEIRGNFHNRQEKDGECFWRCRRRRKSVETSPANHYRGGARGGFGETRAVFCLYDLVNGP